MATALPSQYGQHACLHYMTLSTFSSTQTKADHSLSLQTAAPLGSAKCTEVAPYGRILWPVEFCLQVKRNVEEKIPIRLLMQGYVKLKLPRMRIHIPHKKIICKLRTLEDDICP